MTPILKGMLDEGSAAYILVMGAAVITLFWVIPMIIPDDALSRFKISRSGLRISAIVAVVFGCMVLIKSSGECDPFEVIGNFYKAFMATVKAGSVSGRDMDAFIQFAIKWSVFFWSMKQAMLRFASTRKIAEPVYFCGWLYIVIGSFCAWNTISIQTFGSAVMAAVDTVAKM